MEQERDVEGEDEGDGEEVESRVVEEHLAVVAASNGLIAAARHGGGVGVV